MSNTERYLIVGVAMLSGEIANLAHCVAALHARHHLCSKVSLDACTPLRINLRYPSDIWL